ncbi:ABC transporter permease [Streptomyces oryzae]|uniref:ABC transporter permease n=1 Tax=Streptomyces oryzae TaxID=1434886 RepID=A0ABS3XLS8_9ACTN|nr:ABC transporter permease [Streptomyces oryzae]MBO8196367.1 ABC transporter permease [Streptomyces oryzae]
MSTTVHASARSGSGARGPASPVRWLRRNAVVLVGCAALAYLLVPNLVVLLFSFNKPAGRFNYAWRTFSTDAWTDPCGVADMCGSLGLSLQIAVLATLIATAFGTFAAFALARYRFRGKSTTNALIFLPMAMPEVVMGASLGTLFLNTRVQFGFVTILIAHVMFCLSFVVVAVKARVMSMDPRLEEAARDLYAGPFQTFWRVTLPLAAPGIAAGAMLSFALSFDDFIITQFNAGPSTVTFPMFVWGAAQRGVPVQVNVIGSAMFVLALAIVLGGQLAANRRKKS